MTVKEFCRKYNLKYQTVYRKISAHKNNELAGHIIKEKGESLALDDYAVDFLTPFNIKVIQAVEECEAVITENSELKDKLYAAECNLRQAEIRRSDITADNEKLNAEIIVLTDELSDKVKVIKELELQCNNYRQKISELEQSADNYKKSITELKKSVSTLTEENKLLTEKYEAIPKIFRKNQ